MTLISEQAKEYEELVRSHVTANFKPKTIQYLLVRASDVTDAFYIKNAATSERRAIVLYAYEKSTASKDTLSVPAIVSKLEKEQQNVVNAIMVLKKISLSKPLFQSLKAAIRKAITSDGTLTLAKKFTTPLPSEIYAELSAFIADTRKALEAKTFKPEKQTDPREARRFTIFPVYSFQPRHVTLDNQSFTKILVQAGIRTAKDGQLNQANVRQEYFNAFNTQKIGFPYLGKDSIRTDGYDVQFIFKKPKKDKQDPLKPSRFQHLLAKDPVIWGVDPGINQTFVAAAGGVEDQHRIRKLSSKEYYDVCGYNKATETRVKYSKQDPQVQQLKFKTYINRQKATTEIVKFLIGGSKKYQSITPQPPTTEKLEKWRPLSSSDGDNETARSVIIAFGNGRFAPKMRGTVSGPTKRIKAALFQHCKTSKVQLLQDGME
ncbi:hypothetical protein VTP01DRAFT_6392 [Rhizomucor pusillus]|uniref:uncharacterized protein n=1 Tax=Rhizomucor pusillus TaxID=4840 RepID=UPI003741EAC9